MRLFVLLIFTVIVYLPGLDGPFLFDDIPNLTPLSDWINGVTGWQEALLSSHSGLLGRPLSMLSFVANAGLFGMRPFSFKVTNLVIHLACGSLLWMLLRMLLARDAALRLYAEPLALGICAIWLLHPMQVSTVLYIVQRMAQLSALFVLASLLAFVKGRLALEQGQNREGLLWLFFAFPAAVVAALLSKENGALAPFFCAVLELGYFQSTTAKPLAVRAFFLLTLGLPALVAVAWLALHPGWLPGSYSGRTFTLAQRLLTQPRILFDYMQALALPRGPSLGLYKDGYVVSTGLLQPPATLIALMGLASLIAFAIWCRRTTPVVFTGVAFYLAGHLMESSVLPLELYFEHRNYLPSAGFFMAIVGGAAALVLHARNAPTTDRQIRAGNVAIAALCAVLGVATAARCWVWQSWTTIVEQAATQHPESVRAQLDYAGTLWEEGRLDETQRVFDRLSENTDAVARHMAAIYSVKLACERTGAVDAATLKRMSDIAGNLLQLAEMEAFDRLADAVSGKRCEGLGKSDLATILARIAASAPQPPAQTQVWRTRFRAARLYMDDRDYKAGVVEASQAWSTGRADTSVGIVLSNLYYLTGDIPAAQRILNDVLSTMPSWDVRNRKLASRLQALFDAAPH